MEMREYTPGDTVPLTSPLYHVVHMPAQNRDHMETFYAGEKFPPCPECGMRVRYTIPDRILRLHSK